MTTNKDDLHFLLLIVLFVGHGGGEDDAPGYKLGDVSWNKKEQI